MKKILLSIFTVFVVVSLTACDSSESGVSSIERIKNAGVVKIGVLDDKPPFDYANEKGVNQGYDTISAKRIAKEPLDDENKVEFVLAEAANRVEFLKSNKVDIIPANFTQTPKGAEQVDFVSSYMKVALGVVVPEDSEVKNVENLKDKVLILNKGTTADAYFTKNYADIKALKFDQDTETFAALMGKRGDALIRDNTLLFAWVKERPDHKVVIKELGNQDVIAPAVKKDDKELKELIDNLTTSLTAEQFSHKAHDESLKAHFGADIKADDIVIEGGKPQI